MIEDIKKIIGENRGDIKISKFFHGNPKISTKVLFFLSEEKKPMCLIKMVRDLENNDLINREIEGLKYFNSIGLKTPKIINAGQINGKNYICQEIISGQPVGKKMESKIFPLIAKYHNKTKKIKKLKIASILKEIEGLNIKNDEEYDYVLRMLHEKENDFVFVANQHGDLTYKNIIKTKNDIVFIDFENFGLRSFWGNDIIHYMVRMMGVYETSKKISEILPIFIKKTKYYRDKYKLDISDEDCTNLFLLNLLFEDLQKTYAPVDKNIIPIIKNIWLK